MIDQQLDDKALAIIAKVEKLLTLANHPNTDEAEATAASQAAMRLLEAYNLDMVMVERHSGQTGKREQTAISGGLYKWQRQLWHQVSELNFCIYRYSMGQQKGQKYEHKIVGRVSNVRTARLMAEYLQGTIERLARERVYGVASEFFTKSSVSYREGMADRIVERLQERRAQQQREEAKKQAEEATRARHPGAAPSTANALILADVITAEYDANMDAIHGEGYSARRKAEHAAWEAKVDARIEAARLAEIQWREDHPEEARARDEAQARRDEAERKREERNARRRKGSYRSGPSYKGDSGAYWEGHRKGADVGLDTQVGHRTTTRLS